MAARNALYPLGQSSGERGGKPCLKNTLLSSVDVVGDFSERDAAFICIEDDVLGARVSVARLPYAAGIDQVAPAGRQYEFLTGFKPSDRPAREVGEDHGTVSVAEKCDTDPWVPVGQMVENHLGRLLGPKVSSSVAG